MPDFSCESCQKKARQQAKLNYKKAQEEGEEVSDRVEAVAKGDKDPPTFYGPISGADEEFRCKTCFYGGILGSILVTIVFGVLFHLYPQGYTQQTVGYAVVFVGAVQIAFVLYAGWHPVGAYIGPFLERHGIISEEYSEEEQEEETMTETETEKFDLPDDYFEKEQQLSALEREKQELKETLHEERGRADELSEQIDQKEKQIEQLNKTKQQVEEERDEKVDNLIQVQNKFGRLADFHDFRGRKSERVPIFQYDRNGIRYRLGYFAGWVDTASLQKDESGEWREDRSYIAALVVGNRGDSIGQIPEFADKGDEAIFDYIYPHPKEVDRSQLPEVRHPGEFAWRADNPGVEDGNRFPNVLVQENLKKLRDSRKQFDEASDIPKRVSMTISYDEQGAYVPPHFDSRGFEQRQRLRKAKNEMEVEVQRVTSGIRDKVDDNDMLRNKVNHLNQEVQNLRSKLNNVQQQKLEAVGNIREAEQESDMLERELERKKKDNNDWREYADDLEDEVTKERKKKAVKGSEAREYTLDAKGEELKQEKVEELFRTAQVVGFKPKHENYTLDDVGNTKVINGEEREITKETIVRDFVNDDDYDIDMDEIVGDMEAISK